MPSVPQPASSTRAAHFTPPNPNIPHDVSAQHPHSSTANRPAVQPSPGVTSTTSHVETHVLPRRFLGPIPENVVNSKEVEEKRRRFRDLRKGAIRRLRGGGEDGDFGGEGLADFGGDNEGGGRVRGVVRRIKVRRRGRDGEEVEEELDLDDDPELGHDGKNSSKQKKTRKDVWVGESFDIGREFIARSVQSGERPPPVNRGESGASDRNQGQSNGEGSTPRQVVSRPPVSTRTTQETFVTARTRLSSGVPGASRSSLSLDTPAEGGYNLNPNPQASLGTSPSTMASLPLPRPRNSQSSSVQPLVSSPIEEEGESSYATASLPGKKGRFSSGKTVATSPGISTRLKSALRHTSKSDIKTNQSIVSNEREQPLPRVKNGAGKYGKSKSVQFPVDHAEVLSSTDLTANSGPRELIKRKGNKEPADPEDVLSREGDEAAGTSAGAVEEAMEEEADDQWEEQKRPGEVIMRERADRMLVRVGYHREDNVSGFNEASQRRNPCARLEPMEEYIVVWRKGLIEFYQDWNLPLRERLAGHKHLAFAIPLAPNRTSLSVFNSNDVTLCLTTSVARLQHDVHQILQSTTTRMGGVKDRVKQSRQVQWLRGRRKGTQVFIFKIAERSRAMDWYWELWRDLGGELPHRFDISVPSLSTTVRLSIPEGEESGHEGNHLLYKHFNPQTVIDTCWEMLLKSVDMDDLLEQRKEGGKKDTLDLELAWKSVDGTLDWMAYRTTVQGKQRSWPVLAGLARMHEDKVQRELQLRTAQHQPKALKLEDGTWLDEPPGVEGYLYRLRGSKAKEHIYIASHDGNIFVAVQKEARPPLVPHKEGSTPTDLFPDLHRQFLDGEHRRMAYLIERSAGRVDLRDIVSVKIVEDNTNSTFAHHTGASADGASAGGDVGQSDTFDIEYTSGGSVRLQAASPEVAKEWVERLEALGSYWKRRQRVDARQRMDIAALHSKHDPFVDTTMSNASDAGLDEIWDWCAIKGCRSICLAGRLHLKRDKYDKFRLKYFVLTQGCLVSFKIKRKDSFHPRKKRYPLFGAYVYSGMLAQDELHEASNSDAFSTQARVYQDGLQSSDPAEDTTFCLRLPTSPSRWGKKRTQPWEMEEDADFLPPGLSKKPATLLIFRARSKLERDRWVWAINAEMERQVRSHLKQEEALREYGKVPDRL
ncbi:hypothetical protein CI109_102951 [Kwoniella shandongensis]|uniref:Uncharacterized protein n=1 Tax=Kwoniella shandongensis TaxID=1734106 RepID=A0A5M6CDU1_9TREE|nr:uncharacterized protein CI109_000139 [Kwoniella shandongensis]KAA5531299.1 hypothetical protein CI109_000139 [Kwoniella shandongensis]